MKKLLLFPVWILRKVIQYTINISLVPIGFIIGIALLLGFFLYCVASVCAKPKEGIEETRIYLKQAKAIKDMFFQGLKNQEIQKRAIDDKEYRKRLISSLEQTASSEEFKNKWSIEDQKKFQDNLTKLKSIK